MVTIRDAPNIFGHGTFSTDNGPKVHFLFEKAKKFPSDGVKAKGITQTTMEFVALDDQPFSVVEDVGFRFTQTYGAQMSALPVCSV